MRTAFSTVGLMPFFPAAKRLQCPFDIRAQKAPEDVFKYIRVCFFPQPINPVFNSFIKVKGIATGINDKSSRIRAQIDQIPAQKKFPLGIGFSDEIAGHPIYILLR